MKCNLIIDMNFILKRNAFALSNENTVYGELLTSLHSTVAYYDRIYNFKNVYITCDSKQKKYWRKILYPAYKGKRTTEEDMDWEFIWNTYEQFKDEVRAAGQYILVESEYLEGDDWIHHIVEESNAKSESCVIVASDGDINQEVKFMLTPMWINVQIKDIIKYETVFFPENYSMFVKKLSDKKTNLFKLGDNSSFLQMLKDITLRRKIKEVDPQEVLFLKLISGDKSDNISSILVTESVSKKTGETLIRGIGEAGAKKIYKEYLELYPERINFKSKLFANRVIELVKKYKKDTTTSHEILLEKLFLNIRLMKLDSIFIPEEICSKMGEKLNEMRSLKHAY